jgi:hypothetical protein
VCGESRSTLSSVSMTANTTLRSLQSIIEGPFKYEWAVDVPDNRPLGHALYLPVLAVVYLASLTLLKALLAGATWLERPLKGAALLNNIIMCLYSLWALIGVAAGIGAEWAETGYSLSAPFCDRDRSLLKSLDFRELVESNRLTLIKAMKPCASRRWFRLKAHSHTKEPG